MRQVRPLDAALRRRGCRWIGQGERRRLAGSGRSWGRGRLSGRRQIDCRRCRCSTFSGDRLRCLSGRRPRCGWRDALAGRLSARLCRHLCRYLSGWWRCHSRRCGTRGGRRRLRGSLGHRGAQGTCHRKGKTYRQDSQPASRALSTCSRSYPGNGSAHSASLSRHRGRNAALIRQARTLPRAVPTLPGLATFDDSCSLVLVCRSRVTCSHPRMAALRNYT